MTEMGFPLPKYARVVTELQRRIREGVYGPGDMLPSESQLVREFGVGRTTVVRALQMLQQEGWITREQGVASYVKGVPAKRPGATRPGRALLDRPETGEGLRVAEARPAPLPANVAVLLGLAEGTAGVVRRLVTERDGEPVELVTFWFPEPVASGTDLATPTPLTAGVRQHLRTLKQLRADHITERLSARLPSTQEADLLRIEHSAPVLGVMAVVYAAADRPLLVADVALPGALHELEDTYPVTS